ncbi:MAG TPA: glycosyltransferase family 2 protein [Acidimicrobiia bacterium]|nr:glycosyltransferase family 2 protein [Acidimicrobiia bacterium]
MKYENFIVSEKISRVPLEDISVHSKASYPTTPLFSVIMRTQGLRRDLMEQAIVCLVAQECQDFELVVVMHNVKSDGCETVEKLIGDFGPQLKDRVTIVSLQGGQRGVPLNAGIDVSRGDYIVFLDDDDLVFAHWLSEFKRVGELNPGKIVRSRCVDRFVTSVNNSRIPSYVESGLQDDRARTFSLTQHFFISQTVIHSYATPRASVISAESYFDETFPVVEDWDFLLRNAELWGVVDTDSITCVYNRWTNSGSSLHLHERDTWEQLHNRVLQRFSKRGVLVGPGELVNLYRMWLEHERFKTFAASMLSSGDSLMINKKENALCRSIQYVQHQKSLPHDPSAKQAVKVLAKKVIPRRLHRKFAQLLRFLTARRGRR